MTEVRTYWDLLGVSRDVIAKAMGTDIRFSPPDARAYANATLGIIAALAKALVDNGIITADQLQAATDAALGADGTAWDYEVPSDDVPAWTSMDNFGPELFEGGANGVSVDDTNSDFSGGVATDPLAAGVVSATFDTTQFYADSTSMKTVTNDGASIALRTGVHLPATQLHVRFYFRATAAPASTCSIYAAQFNGFTSGSTAAERWNFEVAVNSSGQAVMYENGTLRAGSGSPPNICDGTWWRIEAMYSYMGTCETRLYGGANVSTTTITYSWTGAYLGGAANSLLVGQPRSQLTSGQSWTVWHDNFDTYVTDWLGP